MLRQQHHPYTASVYPNGEGTLGRIPSRRAASERRAPIESTNVLISHTRERGINGITAYGRRMVRNGAFLLEQHYDRRDLMFGTVTMPAIPEGLRARVIELWPEAVRQFLQWLKRGLARANQKPWVVGVSEVQSKRARREGWAAPHLHWAQPSRMGSTDSEKDRKYREYVFTPVQIRGQWRSIWENLLGKDALPASTYWGSCESIQPVKKSVSRYLSKYLSKGNMVPNPDDPERRILPGWWHMTMDLKQEIWDGMCKGPSVAETILNLIAEDPDAFDYCHQILIDAKTCVREEGLVKVVAGYVFKLVQGRGSPGAIGAVA